MSRRARSAKKTKTKMFAVSITEPGTDDVPSAAHIRELSARMYNALGTYDAAASIADRDRCLSTACAVGTDFSKACRRRIAYLVSMQPTSPWIVRFLVRMRLMTRATLPEWAHAQEVQHLQNIVTIAQRELKVRYRCMKARTHSTPAETSRHGEFHEVSESMDQVAALFDAVSNLMDTQNQSLDRLDTQIAAAETHADKSVAEVQRYNTRAEQASCASSCCAALGDVFGLAWAEPTCARTCFGCTLITFVLLSSVYVLGGNLLHSHRGSENVY